MKEAVARIRERLITIERPGWNREARLCFWRSVIRMAQDEYDRELAELDSLKFPVQDPSLTGVPVE